MAKIASFDFSLECDDVIQDFDLGGIHLTFFFAKDSWRNGNMDVPVKCIRLRIPEN